MKIGADCGTSQPAPIFFAITSLMMDLGCKSCCCGQLHSVDERAK
jgi:hypothetical protein